ncbi:MAG: M20/M25/M40 family metallo-hydrolase, partial [Desulfobacterales bacterium]|nr:M20/M25/M40 family metallo-hydrolase [Desulfobacterales bacterium]
FDIKLHGPARDLHSGVFGGTVPNPATLLVKTLAQLLDSTHRVTIPTFYDDVLDTTPQELNQWDNLTFSDEAWAHAAGVTQLHGEAGFTTLQRRWARPSCDVNGIYGGYMAEGAKTVIPSFAGAKVSFRLAANQDPEKINAAFTAWLHDHTPPGCTWEISHLGSAHPVAVDTNSPYMAAARRAMKAGTNTDPVLVRDGGTIPVIATFKNTLNLDTLLMGFGRNDDNLHSPNEKFNLDSFDKGARSHAALLHELAQM